MAVPQIKMSQDLNQKLHGDKITVVGLGISGLWTARALAGKGMDITVSEASSETDLAPDICREIRELGINLETGGHSKEAFLNADTIIISPGVPHDMELLCTAREKGTQVIGELEFASRLIDTPIIAVTGTNGKTTVTTAMGLIFENAGFDVFVGGNIGTPLIAYAAGEKKADYAIVEVSSFQLDSIETFCPLVSIILNISPDHLDRYSGYENYVQSKLTIFRNQKPGQYIILNDDDSRLAAVRPHSGPTVYRYGLKKKEGRHAFIKNSEILTCLKPLNPDRFDYKSYRLPGRHNLENLLAMVLGARVVGVSPSVIQKTINTLEGLPHRLEYVRELNGITFYNDSKATNVDAAVKAVASFDQPVILIAGGRHKGADYTALVKTAKVNVKKAIFLGEAKNLLMKAFKGILPVSVARDMEDASTMAFDCAERGDVVLLAPACSSFDMFSDYGHRGRVFKSAVERLNRG